MEGGGAREGGGEAWSAQVAARSPRPPVRCGGRRASPPGQSLALLSGVRAGGAQLVLGDDVMGGGSRQLSAARAVGGTSSGRR
jgi:hypothetical protein